MVRLALATAALAVLLPSAATAQLQAELAARGRMIAQRWCANCHLTGPEAGGTAADAAPPFMTIARMPSTTEMSLRVFLQTPHDRMPDYQLSQAELDGIIAYILSLRRR